MDPITTAIVATLPVLASDLVKSSIKDAYTGLKAAILRKWGGAGPIAKSVDALEASPESKHHAEVLSEKLQTAKASADREVMQALAILVEELKKEGLGGRAVAEITVNITGGTVQGVVGANNVSTNSMNFGAPRERGKN